MMNSGVRKNGSLLATVSRRMLPNMAETDWVKEWWWWWGWVVDLLVVVVVGCF